MNLCRYSVQVKVNSGAKWQEVIKLYSKEIAEQCVVNYSKDIPSADFRIVTLF
jgi:hypothetical protein